MFAALEFSDYAGKAGVQPIIGCQLDLCYLPPEPGRQPYRPAPVVLLAQSEAGWMNLMKLNSCAHLQDANGDGLPQVTLNDLERHSAGLICLSGGPDGPLGRLLQAGQRGKAEEFLRRMAGFYPGRLYVELQRHPVDGGLPEAERITERPTIELAYALDLPLVATNDVYFPKEQLFEAHDALLAIAEGAYVDQSGPRRRLTRSTTSRRPRRWRRSSPTSPRPWRTPSRSRAAAPSRCPSASRSCPIRRQRGRGAAAAVLGGLAAR
jgi:DNA polymerase-3 subunit alpha